ncbi:MAG: AraC family transcriptional regulator [Gammaproteobacteria bacterium]|nr:AraC family transcriptional regulator [Gammaproteobacteria bacterium]MBU0819477.1 AraC family transcriptional regulator [Gammaproteobacteria bacterium]MBU0841236.1 AraC family transcriptional regulator [Gammaproteobacteria bacterium]MBU1844022.1 AraC family transcriptional regulator [Gammaproteobacteria bacterium]
MDRLSTLLSQFGVRANLFYNGKLCGMASYDGADTRGHIHLLQAGALTLLGLDRKDLLLTRPSLIFLPRPRRHQLFANEPEGAQLLCASMEFEGGVDNPLSASLPDLLVLPLDELPMLADTLRWMFVEAAGGHCGREAALDRLFELLIILLFRHLLDHHQLHTGMMAGLADSRLARSLVQIHNAPHRPWSIAELASESNMSRAAYAVHFRAVIGQTPADYLLSWRISLAQKRLREGRPITLIAAEVGYESPSALARAFRRKTGYSPRDWMKDSAGEADSEMA